jgi:hypothetical protein
LPSFKKGGSNIPSIAICLPEISKGRDSSLLRPCPYALSLSNNSNQLIDNIEKTKTSEKIKNILIELTNI